MKLEPKKSRLSIPLTHMADVAYLLLIFIIIFSLINTRKKNHDNLPNSDSHIESESKGNTVYITDTIITFNNQEYSDIDDLIAKFEMNEEFSGVTIIADQQTQFGKIKKVLSALKKYNFSPIDFLTVKKK